ncbi:MAG: type II toxin-antitoxin system HicB family antitoxin [Chromatiaceae bacterium]|jgi:predicted RNase H-like HicB family nuclease|nr:type II toxin-antitoxin system HicB family antitoxin [Chromatiaceae bacterium]
MSIKYEIIIYWSAADSAYVAEVPELPGCMADGNSYRKALENAEIIIQEWIETARDLGRTIPEPRGKLMYA